jgi:hypothetical protein
MYMVFDLETEVIDWKFVDKIHIQNCMNCSVLIFNPTCPESVNLRARCVFNLINIWPFIFVFIILDLNKILT